MTRIRIAEASPIRWMIRRDLPDVLDIDARSFFEPWSEADFVTQLRRRECIPHVLELDERVVGYLLFNQLKDRLQVLRLAVHPGWRRMNVATDLVLHLLRRLHEARQRIVLDCPERLLEAQLFLRATSFQATAILPGYCADGSDAYRFELRA